MIKAQRKSQMASVVASFVVHAIALFAMFFIKMSLPDDSLNMVLDSVFSEERLHEEFDREIEETAEVATSMNLVASSSLSTATGTGTGGTGGTVVSQQKIEEATSLQEPTVPVRVGEISIPSANFVAEDLGTGAIKGDVGRVVEGYGPALSQLTQELIRLMREKKLTVVWLFDESMSMRDDQKEIRDKFHKVYEELGLVAKSDTKLRSKDEILQTVIASYGDHVNELTKHPTVKVEEVREAIDKIEIEESGNENMCEAVSGALTKYGPMTQKQRRRLAIVVISDESGTDGQYIEDTVERAKKFKAPVYILGRYSVFGYPYARMRWVDPEYGLTHWLKIDRGPETPFPELLQTDGLHERWDYDSSGFGPYEQVRLARESGGIFFLLPGTEDNIVTSTRTYDDRRFEMLDMREYLPDLSARVDYLKDRDSSKFRRMIFEVVQRMNPHKDDELRIQEIWYSNDRAKYAKQSDTSFKRALRSMQLFNEALRLLDSIKPLREKEQSQRWRANYDLIHAQSLAYRVRLFQFLLAMDAHTKNWPAPSNPKSNVWNIQRVPKLLEPDPQQVKLTKVDMDELNKQMALATKEFQAVIENHPGTPWAKRATWEMSVGFGMQFRDGYRDPRYDLAKNIKFPSP